MAVALRTLGHYIKDATHLQTGKPFQNFGDMRSREAVANWLLCATANAIDGRNLSVASTNDAIGGDGIIHDEDTGESFPTEHVMVPHQSGGDNVDPQALILKAIDDRCTAAYGGLSALPRSDDLYLIAQFAIHEVEMRKRLRRWVWGRTSEPWPTARSERS